MDLSRGEFFKIVAIVLGIVVLGLESYAYDETHEIFVFKWSNELEATLIAFSVICMLGTSAFLILSLMSKGSDMIKKIDMCFHLFGTVALLIGAICLFYAVIHANSKCVYSIPGSPIIIDVCGLLKFPHKLAAASFATINSIVYFVIAVSSGKGK